MFFNGGFGCFVFSLGRGVLLFRPHSWVMRSEKEESTLVNLLRCSGHENFHSPVITHPFVLEVTEIQLSLSLLGPKLTLRQNPSTIV